MEYTYDISETKNAKVNIIDIKSEVLASLTNLSSCLFNPDDIVFEFSSALSSAEEEILDGIVSNHEGLSVPSFALDELVRNQFKKLNIWEVDYTSTKQLKTHLQRRDSFDKGRLIKVEYFEDYDKATDTGTNKMIEVDVVYADGLDNLVSFRTTKRKWYLSDNTTVAIQIESIKKYTNYQGVEEGIHRRHNNINNLKLSIPGLIMQLQGLDLSTGRAKGRDFFNQNEIEFATYIQVDDRTILTNIDNADRVEHDWLDELIAPGYPVSAFLKNEIDY